MIKKLSMAILLFAFASIATANKDCIGIPTITKVGEYQSQELYLIVEINGQDYRLGLADNAVAKASFSLATTALVSNKQLKLRFYGYTDCNTPSNNRVVPNSVQLVK